MKKSILVLSLALFASALFAGNSSAQVTRVLGSGCPGANYVQPVGSPGLGQGFGAIAPSCRSPAARQVMMIGMGARPVAVSPPLGCVRGCTLVVQPFQVVNGGAWRTLIPRNPALVGACFRIQSACIEPTALGRPCVFLHGAIDVCITR